MNPQTHSKSSVDDIRKRFDADVDRFSNLETGQSATIDAPLAMELVTQAAAASTSPICRVLDLGCGAGNTTLKLHDTLNQDFDVDVLDLSAPMVDRAVQRVSAVNHGQTRGVVGDFRNADLPEGEYDVILAAAVLHHLRDESDWRQAFQKLFDTLRPGGGLWITDLVCHELPAVQKLMWSRYGDYLEKQGGAEYRKEVFRYIDLEDSPRSVTFQLALLQDVGFTRCEILHKNSVFAAFGAVKES